MNTDPLPHCLNHGMYITGCAFCTERAIAEIWRRQEAESPRVIPHSEANQDGMPDTINNSAWGVQCRNVGTPNNPPPGVNILGEYPLTTSK